MSFREFSNAAAFAIVFDHIMRARTYGTAITPVAEFEEACRLLRNP